jgi:hypothetical protein
LYKSGQYNTQASTDQIINIPDRAAQQKIDQQPVPVLVPAQSINNQPKQKQVRGNLTSLAPTSTSVPRCSHINKTINRTQQQYQAQDNHKLIGLYAIQITDTPAKAQIIKQASNSTT